jgi:hypothetical protein
MEVALKVSDTTYTCTHQYTHMCTLTYMCTLTNAHINNTLTDTAHSNTHIFTYIHIGYLPG